MMKRVKEKEYTRREGEVKRKSRRKFLKEKINENKDTRDDEES